MKVRSSLASTIGVTWLVAVSAIEQSKQNWIFHRKLMTPFGDSADIGGKYQDLWYGRIYSDETDDSACIQVEKNKARDGQKLILGDCTAEGNGWRGDSNGLIHSELEDGKYCMQAGHGGPTKRNEYIRLYTCDPSNKLQKFVFVNGGGIRPKYSTDLCIVWRGVHPQIGRDPLLLKKCHHFEDRNDWSNDPFSGNMDDKARSDCVDPNIPEFIIDDNVNIGDTLYHPGPGFAVECGPDCYSVKDSGDDPPFDPELGDTLHFAYKEVSSTVFSFQSLICGIDCDGGDDPSFPTFGRSGLMVRGSLDPLARNVFVSHMPNMQADWSYRSVEGGETVYGFDGSPDVQCLWIKLSRDENIFSAWYSYEGATECDQEGQFTEDLHLTLTVEMPETVYVGLAVSTGVSPPNCRYTLSDFKHIECRGCELE